MKLDGEDAVTEEEKADFGSLVRNDRFDAVKLLLMRDIATYSQEPIAEQRDSHGNTAIIVAAQQVFGSRLHVGARAPLPCSRSVPRSVARVLFVSFSHSPPPSFLPCFSLSLSLSLSRLIFPYRSLILSPPWFLCFHLSSVHHAHCVSLCESEARLCGESHGICRYSSKATHMIACVCVSVRGCAFGGFLDAVRACTFLCRACTR